MKRSLVLVGTALLMCEVRAILQRQPVQQLYLLTFSHILHDSVEQDASVAAPALPGAPSTTKREETRADTGNQATQVSKLVAKAAAPLDASG